MASTGFSYACQNKACDKDQEIKGYCKECYQLFVNRYNKSYSRTHKVTDAFYRTEKWKRTSRSYRAKSPLCEHCLKDGFLKRPDMVDHIMAIKDGGSRYDFSNLQSLCWSCHAKKHKTERRHNGIKSNKADSNQNDGGGV